MSVSISLDAPYIEVGTKGMLSSDMVVIPTLLSSLAPGFIRRPLPTLHVGSQLSDAFIHSDVSAPQMFTGSARAIPPAWWVVGVDASGGHVVTVAEEHRDTLPPLLDASCLQNVLAGGLRTLFTASQQQLLATTFVCSNGSLYQPQEPSLSASVSGPVYGLWVAEDGTPMPCFTASGGVFVQTLDVPHPFIPAASLVWCPLDCLSVPLVEYRTTAGEFVMSEDWSTSTVEVIEASSHGLHLIRFQVMGDALLILGGLPPVMPTDLLSGRVFSVSTDTEGHTHLRARTGHLRVTHSESGVTRRVPVNIETLHASFAHYMADLYSAFCGASASSDNNARDPSRADQVVHSVVRALSARSATPEFYDAVATQLYREPNVGSQGQGGWLDRPFSLVIGLSVDFHILRPARLIPHRWDGISLVFPISI
jgi:hypothetical protein